MPNVLEKIIEEKKKLLKLIKKNNSLDSLEEKIKNLKCFLSFKEAIQNNKGVSLITEIKKASPSAGVIIKDFDHLKIAEKYINNGATCLSVLTEEKFFLGNHKYIQDIKNNFKIPILAKDFFIDPYQIALSKSFGCDCVLIIIAAVENNQADEIYAEALKHNLSVIVEVHDKKEAEFALKYDAQETLALLMEDIERVIDDNDNLVYDDSVDPNQSATSLTIGSISTDEGVIAPLGIGEMTVRVRY